MRRDIFQAIADPTRRAIICFIANEAMTPNTLSDQFDISRQAVSKHIRVLDECGMLVTHQIGRERYYQAHPSKLKEVDEWLMGSGESAVTAGSSTSNVAKKQ